MASPQVEKTTQKTVLKPESDVFSRQLDTGKPLKSKASRIWKGLGLVVLALAATGAAFLTFTASGQKISQLGKQGIEGGITYKTNPDLLFDHVGSQVNILLIGRDVNWKIGKVFDPKTGKYRSYQVHDESTPARSDTMIVVSLNKDTKSVRMVSFPRDAIVRLADNDYGVRRTKLNAAHAYGGPPLLIKTMQDELGLTIHRYAVIKFDGFKNLIDQVGGVEIDVDGALKKGRDGKLYRGNLDYDDNWGNLHIHLKPGLQTLDGTAAHAYVRFRMDREGDPGRIRRQQQVMRALAKQMAHVSWYRLPGLIQEVQTQFVTDMSTSELASAAAFAKGIGDASKIQPITLFGTYSSNGSIVLNKPKNDKLLSYIFGSTFNPARFLQRSPSTKGDEIGPANDATPDAKAILQAAGILRPDGELTEDASAVPVRIEETSTEASLVRPSRYAATDDENQAEEKPRRTTKKSTRSSASSKTRSETKQSSASPPETASEAPAAESSSADNIIGDTPTRHDSVVSVNETAPAPAEETHAVKPMRNKTCKSRKTLRLSAFVLLRLFQLKFKEALVESYDFSCRCRQSLRPFNTQRAQTDGAGYQSAGDEPHC